MSTNRIALSLTCSIILALGAHAASAEGEDEWRNFFQAENGDVHFFDASRVESTSGSHAVWTRIRYKASVMGASSYQSLLEIDCSERTERTLQRTFFSDKHWEKPAMSVDRKQRPKKPIAEGSAAARLSEILCDQ